MVEELEPEEVVLLGLRIQVSCSGDLGVVEGVVVVVVVVVEVVVDGVVVVVVVVVKFDAPGLGLVKEASFDPGNGILLSERRNSFLIAFKRGYFLSWHKP